MESGDKPKKAHKVSKKKVQKKKEKQTGKVEKHNSKAFTFSGGVRSVQKRVQYTLDKQSKKDRAPKIDKNPDQPPPFIVVVQGPPGVGKTTLVKSLVRHYCRQRLLEIRGPITLVSGRQRRLTIIECPQDMSAMLDLAKVADLVLLMIDASYGFELETFEFINILQIHGFPRVIGVLTHLDGFKETKQLRKVKKTMKTRFWSEVYDGAKLFYFSGLQYGRYHRLEIQNLARFIAVTKGSILSWRQNHPYVMALRWEDQTEPTAPPDMPRKLDIYGYVYGGRLREGTQAHLPGMGDFTIAALKKLPDPCPAPADVEAEHRRATGKDKDGKVKKQNALRTLADRHRIVYAPGSDIGSITVDDDAMYINVSEHDVGFTKASNEAETGRELPEAVRLVRELQGSKAALDRATAARPELRLVGNATVRLPEKEQAGDEEAIGASTGRVRRPWLANGAPTLDENENEGDDEDEEEEDDEEEAEEEADIEAGDDEAVEAAEGDDDDADADEAHRQTMVNRARARFEQAPRLEDVIYGKQRGRGAAVGGSSSSTAPVEKRDSAPTDHAKIPLFEGEDDGDDDMAAAEQEASSRKKGDHLGNLGDINGFDTTRMPALLGEKEPWDEERKEALKSRKFITGGWSSAEEDEENDEDEEGVKKKKTKGREGDEAQPDKNADGEAAGDDRQKDEPAATDGAAIEGFGDSVPIATFVRIRLEDVPSACVAELRKDKPLILGGVLAGESRLGYVQLRVKRHRWHPKTLKSGDPLLLSVGWRRFQTVPTFSLEDRGEKRMRYLKYTLEHAHCTMTYYGPSVPPNTGVLACRSWQKVTHFRVSATGGVLESAPNFDIMKKLKLVGEPYKVFRNTAFVRNMFTSDLEVNKYAHTKIQTVSGIRGEIKKAEGTKGDFRATFEDRILMSDLVVCKCWIGVQLKQFYHPVIDVGAWRPAKLIGELRAEAGVPVPYNKDSQYGKQVMRPERKFNPLKIPASLEGALPFKTKPKLDHKKTKNAMRKKAAIVSSERDREINQLLTRLHTIRREKKKIRDDASSKKKILKEKREKFIQDKRDAHSAEAKKKRYIKQGNEEKRRRKALRLD